jgi:ribose transport system substrate-binding protein
VWFISLALAIPYSQQVWDGVEQGAEALGMEAKSFDGKFSPTDVSRGIDLAIQDKADAIILHALPPSVVAPALAKADAAGIKLISAETQNPGPPLPDVPDTIDAIAGHSYSKPATIMAAKVVADSGGDANVLFYSASDIGPGSKQGTDTFVAEMKKLCADCKVKVTDSPIAQWSGMTQRIASTLRANPDINYVVPIFDGMAVYLVPGIQSAGAADRVKIVSGDATPSVLENLKRGTVVIGDVGQPNVWTGVAIMDQTARVLAGETPLEDIGVQYRLFTESNVGDLDLKSDPTPWYGDVDFIGAYKKIWGLG